MIITKNVSTFFIFSNRAFIKSYVKVSNMNLLSVCCIQHVNIDPYIVFNLNVCKFV